MTAFFLGVYIQNLNKLILGFFIYEKVDKETTVSWLINSFLHFISKPFFFFFFGAGEQSRYNRLCIILHFSYLQINSTNALGSNCTIPHSAIPEMREGFSCSLATQQSPTEIVLLNRSLSQQRNQENSDHFSCSRYKHTGQYVIYDMVDLYE